MGRDGISQRNHNISHITNRHQIGHEETGEAVKHKLAPFEIKKSHMRSIDGTTNPEESQKTTKGDPILR